MPRFSFKTSVFIAGLTATVLALGVAGMLISRSIGRQNDARTQATLVGEARLAAELIGDADAAPAPSPAPDASLDAEADRIGASLGARVTLIAPDGTVVGDSTASPDAAAGRDNEGAQPEVVAAREHGLGLDRRAGTTSNAIVLYVAVPVRHPRVAFLRVAMPLGDVGQQRQPILIAALTALGLAVLAVAAIAFIAARPMGQRVRTIAGVAARYRQGDFTPPQVDYGDDEVGRVARAFDDSVQQLGGRLAELARDRGQMAAILAGMIEGVIVVDAQGRLELVNRAAAEMLKLTEPSLGRPYVETIRHPGITDLVGAALGGRRPEAVELAPPRDPSRTVIARATSTATGRARGVILVLHDITELKRADQIRRDFVANVSHELRTPLTAIRGYVEALSEGDDLPEEAQRFLEVITRHTLRMERLVKDLLRLARLDAGQESLEVGSCDLGSLANAVASDVAASLDARGQHLEVVIARSAETVRADPLKLHDALRNLVANASTYGPERSTIRIATRRDGDRVAIDVVDEGPGIPDEDLTRVFERFYRVDKSRARDPGGTGLGLAIVKHLVELQGGTVIAANREQGGAIFTVRLPG